MPCGNKKYKKGMKKKVGIDEMIDEDLTGMKKMKGTTYKLKKNY